MGRKCPIPSKLILVSAELPTLLPGSGRGDGSGGGTLQSFIRGGSAPRSNPLPFYIPLWQKRYLFCIPLTETRYYPFHMLSYSARIMKKSPKRKIFLSFAFVLNNQIKWYSHKARVLEIYWSKEPLKLNYRFPYPLVIYLNLWNPQPCSYGLFPCLGKEKREKAMGTRLVKFLTFYILEA